ncbi:MAG: hypothetical protein GDA49_11405 [Rhodospirillales bacterium]|nr:hypothetical protein [Rhodospirillales bacterium]
MEGDALTASSGLRGDALIIFIGSVVAIATSLWVLAFRPLIPVSDRLPRGFTRLMLELCNDWIRLFGGWMAAAVFPVGLMLALGTLQGGMQFWHWPVAIVIFAVVAVWRLR